MAIPFILIALGVASGATGATLGVHSAVTIKDSKDYISEAEKIQNSALNRLSAYSKRAVAKQGLYTSYNGILTKWDYIACNKS